MFGANALAEAFFGGCLAYIYWYTNYNLIAPILVHALYDACTIFITWQSASQDLQTSIIAEDKRLKSVNEQISNEDSFETFSHAVMKQQHF